MVVGACGVPADFLEKHGANSSHRWLELHTACPIACGSPAKAMISRIQASDSPRVKTGPPVTIGTESGTSSISPPYLRTPFAGSGCSNTGLTGGPSSTAAQNHRHTSQRDLTTYGWTILPPRFSRFRFRAVQVPRRHSSRISTTRTMTNETRHWVRAAYSHVCASTHEGNNQVISETYNCLCRDSPEEAGEMSPNSGIACRSGQ